MLNYQFKITQASDLFERILKTEPLIFYHEHLTLVI